MDEDVGSRIDNVSKTISALQEQQTEKAKLGALKTQEAGRLREQLRQLDCEREAVIQELAVQEQAEEWQQHQEAAGIPSAYRTTGSAAPGSSGHTNAAVASTIADALVPRQAMRPARVLLGACMPNFLSPNSVVELIVDIHEQICAFADVRIVVTRDFTKGENAHTLHERLGDGAQRAAKRAGRDAPGAATGVDQDRRIPEAKVFSHHDQSVHPYHCASELARWADVLLVAPLDTQTLSSISTGSEEDLLLDVVQVRAPEWRGSARGFALLALTGLAFLLPHSVAPLSACACVCVRRPGAKSRSAVPPA